MTTTTLRIPDQPLRKIPCRTGRRSGSRAKVGGRTKRQARTVLAKLTAQPAAKTDSAPCAPRNLPAELRRVAADLGTP